MNTYSLPKLTKGQLNGVLCLNNSFPKLKKDKFYNLCNEFNRVVGVNLTHRQIECLALVCLGRSNPKISLILGISCSTVCSHEERALAKLDLFSTKYVFQWALSKNVLEMLVHIGISVISLTDVEVTL
jgi:DNA-binding CsgD family transcriptional regulator